MSSNQEVRHQQPRRRGPMGRGMQPGEKPKDLKKSIKQLMQYIGKYKIGIFIVMICAACSTVFTVIGPKILGKATTALSEGLMDKIKGTGLESSCCLYWGCICAVHCSALFRAGS